MYEIQNMDSDLTGSNWHMFKDNFLVFSGTFKKVVRFAVMEKGFDINDFERAVQSMAHKDHNTLHFDASKRIHSTSYQPVKIKKKTG